MRITLRLLLLCSLVLVLLALREGEALLAQKQPASPLAVPAAGKAPDKIVAVAAGGEHTCTLSEAGAVRCVGENGWGQLGDGTTEDRLTPVDVAGLGRGVQAIAAGGSHTCALTAGGGVLCWGRSVPGAGRGGEAVAQPAPVAVAGLEQGVRALAAGGSHTCALRANEAAGGVLCWGANDAGQLGNSGPASAAPVAVAGLEQGVQALAAGDWHTCALTERSEVLCWGSNFYGQVGDSAAEPFFAPPAPVAGLGRAAAIAAGTLHTCALLEGGGVKCWGRNGDGQLGDGATADRFTPVSVAGLGRAAAVAAGGFHTCALVEPAGVECWGYNLSGQVGDGAGGDRLLPAAVEGLGAGAASLALGGEHTCALTTAGAVRCWGGNGSGQLGDATRTDRARPVAMLAADPFRWDIGLTVDTQDRAAVAAFYRDLYLPDQGVASSSTGDVATCTPGSTSAAFRAAVARRVNFYRALAGAPAAVALDEAKNRQAQAAALMMAAAGELSHFPAAGWPCSSPEGQEGASANLVLVSGLAALDIYMEDPGESNRALGHRMWLLRPTGRLFGVGDIPPSPGRPGSNALYVRDDTLWAPFSYAAGTRDGFLAWPPPGYFPQQLTPERWHFQYGGEPDELLTDRFARAAVTVRRGSLTYTPEVIHRDLDYIVWTMPAGLLPRVGEADAALEVSVAGVVTAAGPRAFRYSVTTFDAAPVRGREPHRPS